MINPEKFSQSTAEILADRRIGMVRLTVTKRNLERVKEIINSLSKYNITISTNLIRVSRLGHKELNEFCLLYTSSWITQHWKLAVV